MTTPFSTDNIEGGNLGGTVSWGKLVRVVHRVTLNSISHSQSYIVCSLPAATPRRIAKSIEQHVEMVRVQKNVKISTHGACLNTVKGPPRLYCFEIHMIGNALEGLQVRNKSNSSLLYFTCDSRRERGV